MLSFKTLEISFVMLLPPRGIDLKKSNLQFLKINPLVLSKPISKKITQSFLSNFFLK